MTKHLYLVAIALIVIPSIFFAAFIIPFLYSRVGYYFIIPWLALLVSSISTLLVARSIDPGYLPKTIIITQDTTNTSININDNNNNNEQEQEQQKEQEENNPSSSSDSISSLDHPNSIEIKKKNTKKIIYIDGESVTIQYCKSCNIYRPPRASHCSDCNRCVLEFDHHCPWISNCVGKRNYRYFVYFVWSAVGLAIITMSHSILAIIRLTDEQGSFVAAVAKSPVSLMIAAYAFLLFWTLIGLGGYHLHLICKDVTTREDLKGLKNPYKKSTSSIIFRFLFLSKPPVFPKYNESHTNNNTNHNINISKSPSDSHIVTFEEEEVLSRQHLLSKENKSRYSE